MYFNFILSRKLNNIHLNIQKNWEQKMYSVDFSKDVLFHGRYKLEESNILLLDWAFSGFSFRFEGTKLTIDITGPNESWPICFIIDYDGNTTDMIEIKQEAFTYTLDFPAGQHLITIRRMTKPLINIPFNIQSLRIEGKILEKPEEKVRKIEFIGDSITCGYGVTCESAEPQPFRAIYQDVRKAFPGIIGQRFGAEIRTNAWSGVGVYCNYNSEPIHQVMEWYPRLLPWRGNEMFDFSTWNPDIVVIGEGTNDCSGKAPPEKFKQKVIELLEFVNTNYPNRYIIWFYGMMNNEYSPYLRESINAFNEKKGKQIATFIEFEHMLDDEVGGNLHPNVKAHVKYAKVIGDKIKELLNW